MEEKLLEALRTQYVAEINRLKNDASMLSIENRRLSEENRKLWRAIGLHQMALGYASGEMSNFCNNETVDTWYNDWLSPAEDSVDGIISLTTDQRE